MINETEVKKLLDDIGIEDNGKIIKGMYVIELQDSDDYARYYTLLDQYDELELNDTSSMSQEFANVLTYINDKFKAKLSANFTDNRYIFSVEENKN